MTASDLRPMTVLGVRVHIPLGEVVVLLRPEVPGPDEEGLLLPVTIGPREGAAIQAVRAGIVPPRPQTHDLMLSLLRAAGREVDRVEIVALRSGVFFAEIVLSDGTRVDSRTSDAIALALRAEAPVLCHPHVLAEAGMVEMSDGEETVPEEPPIGAMPSESELAQFRAFLESVEPEDFEDTES